MCVYYIILYVSMLLLISNIISMFIVDMIYMDVAYIYNVTNPDF